VSCVDCDQQPCRAKKLYDLGGNVVAIRWTCTVCGRGFREDLPREHRHSPLRRFLAWCMAPLTH
jgi:transposase-like protein